MNSSPIRLRFPPAIRCVTLAVIASTRLACGEEYNNWAAGHFSAADRAAGLAAPGMDPDADQWPNLLEYISGCDPRSHASRPAATIDHSTPASFRTGCPLSSDAESAGFRVQVSNDFLCWHTAAAVVPADACMVTPLHDYRFVRIAAFALPGAFIDSDGDGLHDLFEEEIAAADPNDPLRTIADVRPDDDADGDGIANIDEAGNSDPPASGFSRPVVVDQALVATTADQTTSPAPESLSIHTPLQ